ncbi:MAG: NAD(P)/FAD-dependent oxidoreductase [Oscillospiraceae bacterium]|nr:NAD(P)/FAD-dependent oxidoreductase [Oscillospiraceae bacterium]
MEIFLIVGGGAAGLMAAYTAAQHGAKAAVLERNENMGQKLLLTGKGRCNLTNNCAELRELIANIPGNGQFLYSAFAKWMPQDTMDFFEKQGVSLKTERGRRVFPLSDAAADVVKALVHACRKSGVSFIRGRAEKLILEDKVCCGVIYADGREYCADRVIVATGGLFYPKTCSSGVG